MIESDEHLAALVAATGDRRAFSALVRRRQALVRSMLARMTGDRALAEDLSQETFIKAYSNIASYSGKGSFKSWLCSIAYREFLMSRRRRQSGDRMIDQLTQETELDEAAARRPRAGEAMDLDRALNTLGAEERAAVVLCYACGMSHGEAAAAMDAPLGTVKSWVNRGRAKMKERLGDYAPG